MNKFTVKTVDGRFSTIVEARTDEKAVAAVRRQMPALLKSAELVAELATTPRGSDGRFALRLESNAAVQRDLLRSQANQIRRQQVEQENADWAAQNNVPVEDLSLLFA